jgi:hypothetical protein
MTDLNENSDATTPKRRGPAWLPYAAVAAMAIILTAAFLHVDGDDLNSKFLFNNPVREVILTTGIAVLGLMGCMMTWNRRSFFTKGNPKSSELFFCALVTIFILTQVPFFKMQTKFEVLLAETTIMDAALTAVLTVADDPANGISQETRKLLAKELYRQTLIQSGDLKLHKTIK